LGVADAQVSIATELAEPPLSPNSARSPRASRSSPSNAAAEVLVSLEPPVAALEQQAALAFERAPTGAQ
jgi:hypothetical protein